MLVNIGVVGSTRLRAFGQNKIVLERHRKDTQKKDEEQAFQLSLKAFDNFGKLKVLLLLNFYIIWYLEEKNAQRYKYDV